MFNPTLIHDYLTLSARRYPEKEALICGEERLTYRALDQRSTQLAHALAEVGVRQHDRVIVFLDNCAEAVIAMYGILKAGAAFVILNGSFKAGKLGYIMKDSGAKAIVTHTSKAEVVHDALEDLPNGCPVIWAGAHSGIPGSMVSRSLGWNEIFQAPAPSGLDLAPGSLNHPCERPIDWDLAALIYTSGSTGEPKGVMAPHFNMLAVARSIIEYLANTKDDILLDALPLSFGYGLYQVITAVMVGGTVVLERSFLYPLKVLERIPKERVTGFPIVPTVAAMLLKMQNLTKMDFTSLRYLTNAAAALPVDHIQRLRAIFRHARLYSMYGLTECSRVSYLPPEELDRRPSSVGKAIPNCQVFVVDEQDQELPPGEVGELVIRGANVMRGYWNAPELTAKVFRNGLYPGETLLYSGDLFRTDEEGFLYFVGRKDDMIKTRGERVSPREIENLLHKLKGVVEAAVVGMPDEVLGEAIKCFVVCNPETALTKIEIFRFCALHLEPFMVPKEVEWVNELPRTIHAKIDKNALRALAIPKTRKELDC